MSYKIAIVGPKGVVAGFKALGVTPFDAENGADALAILKELKANITDIDNEGKEKFASVILIESLANQISPEDMEKVSRGALPAIVLLPGIEGSSGAGLQKLKVLAEKAVGTDILS